MKRGLEAIFDRVQSSTGGHSGASSAEKTIDADALENKSRVLNAYVRGLQNVCADEDDKRREEERLQGYWKTHLEKSKR